MLTFSLWAFFKLCLGFPGGSIFRIAINSYQYSPFGRQQFKLNSKSTPLPLPRFDSFSIAPQFQFLLHPPNQKEAHMYSAYCQAQPLQSEVTKSICPSMKLFVFPKTHTTFWEQPNPDFEQPQLPTVPLQPSQHYWRLKQPRANQHPILTLESNEKDVLCNLQLFRTAVQNSNFAVLRVFPLTHASLYLLPYALRVL